MSKSIILILLLGLVSTATFGYPSYAQDWPHRSVLFFAPANDAHVKQFLLETLMNECELEERDVVTLVIAEDGFTFPKGIKEELDISVLSKKYGVKQGEYTAILLGKDGLEKYRWGAETDWQFINELIDEMPMRKQEMQAQHSPCKI
ncbi:MAG: DUF4174 domain-containing protein [Vibrionaceae bacterium]|nr:DUF4174 domain-containing protein [Vibrionaceae bacterium]